MSEVDWDRSLVGVASEGLQKGGDSQLFVLKQPAWRLYHSYAVVGKVTEGMGVIDDIKRGDRIRSARVLGSRAGRREIQVMPRSPRRYYGHRYHPRHYMRDRGYWRPGEIRGS